MTTTDEVHPDIATALAEIPGGIVIDSHHAEWPELGMTIDAPSGHERAVGSCADGKVCAFTGANLTGTRVSFSTCGTYSPGITVRSIANARSAGYLQARSSSGSVLATAIATSWANVSGSVATLNCVP